MQKRFFIITAVFILLFSAQSVLAQVTISVVAAADKAGNTVLSTVSQGNEFYLLVKVSDAANLAGAALTVSYNKDVFETLDGDGVMPDVDSDTFVTFTANSGGQDNPRIGNVMETEGKILLSGAYIDSTTGGGAYTGAKILFRFPFRVKTTATDGAYSVAPVQTVLNNAAAGWNNDPVHPLVGVASNWQTLPLAEQFIDINFSLTPTSLTVATNAGASGQTVTQSYSSGLNLVPFSISDGSITETSQWGAAIEAANSGITVSEIIQWNPVAQAFDKTYRKVLPMSVFTLTKGWSYFVKTDGTANLTLSGIAYNYIHLYPKLNLFAIPPSKVGTITTAAALATEISTRSGVTIIAVIEWDPVSQAFTKTYRTILPMSNFDLDHTRGYFVDAATEGYYYP